MPEGAVSQQRLKAFTALGDPALLLIVALAVLLYLWITNDPHKLARSWILLSTTCVALTVAGKLLCYLLDWQAFGVWRMHSPSGHVAIATAVYGGCATLLAAGRAYLKRLIVWTAAGALVMALALSRLMLRLHSVAELAAGLSIGVVCLGGFWLSLSPAHKPIVKASHLVALLLLINVARFVHIDGEALVAQLSKNIQLMRLH